MLSRASTPGDEEQGDEELVVEWSTDTVRTDVRLSGALDLVGAPKLGAALDQLQHGGSRHIVLDLAGLDFVGAAGLAVFVQADQALRTVGGELTLTSPSRMTQRVLALTGLDTVLTVE